MADNKKSFVLYCDLINTVEKLPDDEAGKLLKHLLNYVNDNNPETDSLLVEIAFEHIKQQLKRDLQKYENRCKANKANGNKGGRPKTNKTENNPHKPNGLNGKPKETRMKKYLTALALLDHTETKSYDLALCNKYLKEVLK